MRTALLACAVTGALFASASAQAASATGNLNVSATVNASCVVVGAGTMDFGNYDPAGANNAAPKDVDGTFNVRCTKGTSARIWLLEGNNKTGTSTCTTPQRQMGSAANRLPYFLYQDTARTTPWGCVDASSPTAYVSASANTSALQTVYGRIQPGQDVAVAANYVDVVTIQLNF